MCMYQTKADGSLVIPNKEPEKVELLHKIKTLSLNFEVPSLLFYFLVEAEEELFNAQGCEFRGWLEGLKDDEKEELVTLDEMRRGKDENERRNKAIVLGLLKKFLEV